MKTKLGMMTVMAAVALLGGGAAYAHHSLDGEFDQQKLVKLKGTISKVDWINPHIYFTVDVKDAQGRVTKWQAETVPVAMARRAGINAAMLQGGGQQVEVSGFAARNGKNLMFGNKLVYSDGKTITFVGFKE
jgi:hypothetical protein